MPESADKKAVATPKPTSFSLDSKVLERLKNAHRKLEVTKTAFVAAAIHRLAARVESGEVNDLQTPAPTHDPETPRTTAADLPDPFMGLSDDQISTVQNLVEILKAQPQGAIFRSLDLTLQLAVAEYRKNKSTHEAAKPKAPRESSQPPHRKSTGTGRNH